MRFLRAEKSGPLPNGPFSPNIFNILAQKASVWSRETSREEPFSSGLSLHCVPVPLSGQTEDGQPRRDVEECFSLPIRPFPSHQPSWKHERTKLTKNKVGRPQPINPGIFTRPPGLLRDQPSVNSVGERRPRSHPIDGLLGPIHGLLGDLGGLHRVLGTDFC